MTMYKKRLVLIYFFLAPLLIAKNVPIILPNAPGLDSIEINQQRAIEIADTSYSFHEVIFLKKMIIHHEQALLLSRLVPSRTNTTNLIDLASRIDSSQEDEILFMNS